jgi:hypothetical protein
MWWRWPQALNQPGSSRARSHPFAGADDMALGVFGVAAAAGRHGLQGLRLPGHPGLGAAAVAAIARPLPNPVLSCSRATLPAASCPPGQRPGLLRAATSD